MLDKLIQQSVKNKIIVLLGVAALIAFGVFSMMNLTIDAVPDITNNQVQVVTSSPSLAAKEVEQFITYPIEIAMANVQHVQEIRSISRYGLSVVTVVFDESVPVLDARQLVGQQLQSAISEIPVGYGEPSLMPITTGLGEIYQYILEVEEGYEHKYTATDLRTIHDWVVKRQLNGIPGIVEISSFGGFLKQYEIAVAPQKLSTYNLSLLEVNEALRTNNQNTGGSYVQKGAYAYYIRANGIVESIEDIENIVVAQRGDMPILISDVADVRTGHPPRFGAMTADGKGEAVGGITLMLKGGNASRVIKQVKDRIAEVQKNLPEGVRIKPYLDRSELVNKVISTVTTNLIEGGLIVVFILVLLLGNFRAGLVVASVIPLAMLFAFGMMYVFDVTATVMSLGAIDFGLIVDATVIIVESIIYQIEKQKHKMTGAQMDELVMNSTLKIRNSAAFGAIIILIVYFPILSLSGIEGKMFKPMALTVGFAIIGALILSFTYVPVISTLFLSKQISEKKTMADRLMDLIYRSYKPVINFALSNKTIVLSATVVIFVSSLFVFNRLGAEFLPDLDEGDLAMQMTIPPGSSLTESVKSSTKAEKVLLANFPEIKTVVSKIGTAEVPTDPMAIEDADVMIILKPRKEWVSAHTREELVGKMKEKLEVVLGAEFEFTQPIQLRFNELLTGAKADVVVKIYGEDLGILFEQANKAAKIIETVEGAADIKVEQIEGLPQLVIDYDRKKIARYGLNIEEVNTMIRTALAGEKVGVMFEGEKKFDMVVRLKQEARNDLDEFKNLYIKIPNGTQIPLSEVANLEFVESPMQVSRDNTQRKISIGINVRGRDVQSLVEEIQLKLDNQLKLPIGYTTSYGGKFENLQSALNRLLIVVPLALALIFLLLYFAFGTMRQATLIFITIPLSIIGGIFALWVRGLPFSISAGIGFIALFGVAVLDGIVLINYLNELKQNKINDLHERIRMATKSRLRPVTITSAVASLGFLPMALSTSAGAEVQRPLATVVIGGIISSTFLTMVVLPLVYYYFEKGIKIPAPSKIASVIGIGFLLGLPFTSLAQKDTVALSLDELISRSKTESPVVKMAEKELRYAQYGKKSAFTLGNTALDYEHGQINSDAKDYRLTIRQEFGNILKLLRQSNTGKSKVRMAELNLQQKKWANQQAITRLYIHYNYLTTEATLYDTLTLYLHNVAKIAQTRLEAGSSDYMENIRAANQYRQSKIKLADLNGQKQLILKELQLFFNTDSFLVFQPNTPNNFRTETGGSGNINLSNSTTIKQKQEAIKLREAETKEIRSDLFPQLYAGYFNQQIDGVKGFQGWQIGVSVPLFFISESRKIQQAKINQSIASDELMLAQQELQNRLEYLYTKNQFLHKQMADYEQFASQNFELMRSKTFWKYKQGEISYTEFSQIQQELINQQINFQEFKRDYQLNVLEITTLENN